MAEAATAAEEENDTLSAIPTTTRTPTLMNQGEGTGAGNGSVKGDTDTPTHALVAAVFADIEKALAATSLGPKRWYIIVLACLVAGPNPEAAGQLYLHLCSQPQYQTPEARRALVRRLRETLVKAVSLVGVCKPIEAILAIAAVEKPEDRDRAGGGDGDDKKKDDPNTGSRPLVGTRAGWQCDEANEKRGVDWFQKLYTRNASDTLGLFDAHPDFAWLSRHITYGLYLSDRQVLDDIDTQMVVLPAIISQNLRTESWWHIRGCRRIGLSINDVRAVCAAAHSINAYYGIILDKVPTVEEVEPDV